MPPPAELVPVAANDATAAMPNPDRYAVIGNPIAHSRSPAIHARFAEQTQQTLVYERLLAPLDGFVATVTRFVAEGGKGLNVTVPFKLEAHTLANALSPRARAAGAVNTLRVEVDGLYGDNTDGAGLVRDIEHNLQMPLRGRRVLLLGAGGAARGAILPLLECMPTELVIVNRTAARALELVQRFAADAVRLGCRLDGGDSALSRQPFDVVINATSTGLADTLPAFDSAALTTGTLAYDMMYGAAPTPFLRHAAACGAVCADGLGMLVEQAAESFYLWRGVRPDSAAVLAAMRAELGGDQPK